MPKPKAAAKNVLPSCDCGPLSPQQPDDKEIPFDTDPQQVLAKIMLICDDTTGVFFFRNNQKLYLRVVKAPSPGS